MKLFTPTSSFPSLRLLGVSLAVLFTSLAASTTAAADAAKLDQSTPPLTVSFERKTMAEGPPYVLTVTNAAGKTLKTKGHVLLSVASHNRDRARQLPEQELRQGQSRKIDELAAHDRVVLNCDGYAALEITVPGTK